MNFKQKTVKFTIIAMIKVHKYIKNIYCKTKKPYRQHIHQLKSSDKLFILT